MYVVSQRHFVKYVASGAVVVLSLVAFGKCATREEIFSINAYSFGLTAGGLGKPEMINLAEVAANLCCDQGVPLLCPFTRPTY